MSESKQTKSGWTNRRLIKAVIGIGLGALAGFAYYSLVSCTSGG